MLDEKFAPGYLAGKHSRKDYWWIENLIRQDNPGRTDLIQYLIDKNDYKTYLEIGVRNNETFDAINIENKEGVDPVYPATHNVTSDTFFENITRSWDIIFIDGLHERGQFKRDVLNSMNHLNPGGVVVCHDVDPFCEALLKYGKSFDVWEGFVELRQQYGDQYYFACTGAEMCGLVKHANGLQKKYTKEFERNWDYLSQNRLELLNILTPEEFMKVV